MRSFGGLYLQGSALVWRFEAIMGVSQRSLVGAWERILDSQSALWRRFWGEGMRPKTGELLLDP